MPENKKLALERAFNDVLNILYGGDSWKNDDNLQETPKRMAKMYVDEIFRGLTQPEAPKLTVFKKTANSNMVTLFDVEVKSTCSHHFLPFVGRCHIGYIPRDGVVCGISKLARIVEYFMTRPQMQEILIEQITDYIQEKLNPLGVIVVMEARHYCMIVRGVKQFKSKMVSAAVRGCFDRNTDGCKDEFYALLAMGKDANSF